MSDRGGNDFALEGEAVFAQEQRKDEQLAPIFVPPSVVVDPGTSKPPVARLLIVPGIYVTDPSEEASGPRDSSEVIPRTRDIGDVVGQLTNQVLDLDPKTDARLFNNRGCAHAWGCDYELAREDFKRALDPDTDDLSGDGRGAKRAAKANLALLEP